MDEDGLRDLWHIAFSPKTNSRLQHGRQMVGKFGIGKLATYVLANRLTYICKAEDQVIRRVTMDYGEIDRRAEPEKLLSQLSLDMFEVTDAELTQALEGVAGGVETLKLISGETPVPTNNEEIDNDFGAEQSILSRNGNTTWTLIVLSGLKTHGRALKVGILKRMLRAALPLSTEMLIRMNGEPLTSMKSEVELLQEWQIGDDLKFTELNIDSDSEEGEVQDQESNGSPETVEISYSNDAVPHALLPEVRRVTGRVRLYKERISGGKSEERGVSNGFLSMSSAESLTSMIPVSQKRTLATPRGLGFA